jgi:alkylhydroperoxidase/carboxymuconolactone decarboxylase family protein YurZ
MMILTAQRLHRLATWEHLQDSWYLIATVTLTVCNRPQEIPRLYHYAMHTNNNTGEISGTALYDKVDSILHRFADIQATGLDRDYNPYGENVEFFRTTDKLREAILKTAALTGLPKSINALMLLKDTTPTILRNITGNRPHIESWPEYVAQQNRGKAHWDTVYGKVSGRVQSQMELSYPDLWNYAIENVYSPLLSFNGPLTAQETALAVVAALVPQDVNPQLKGHLKGALNLGVPKEKVNAVRDMAIVVSGWCNVEWRNRVASL